MPVHEKSCVVALDAGTGGGRCLVVGLDGRIQASDYEEWRYRRVAGLGYAYEFDPEGVRDALGRVTRRALEQAGVRPSQVAAISTTSFRDGVVFLDRGGRVLYPGTNRDMRAAGEAFELAQNHGEMIYRITGRWPMGLEAASHLLWARLKRPDLFARIACVMMVNDWLTFWLSGIQVCEPTNASSSGLLDVAHRSWSAELLELHRLPASILPPLCEPGTVVGLLLPQAAEALGLASKIPVAVGGGDTMMAALGCSALEAGDVTVVAGTSMPIQLLAERPVLDSNLAPFTGAHPVPGLWTVELVGGLAGIIYRWYRDTFAAEETAEAHRLGVDTFDLINQSAEQANPGSATALLGPDMPGNSRMSAAPRLAFLFPFGSIDGPGFNHASMARSILENIAFAVRGNLDMLCAVTGYDPARIRLCGGLARSSLLARIVAATCRRPVAVPMQVEATGVGVAACAATGAGAYPDLLTAARRMVSWQPLVEPDEKLARTYVAVYKKWLAARQALSHGG